MAEESYHRLSHCEDLFVLVAHLNGTEGEGIVDALQEKRRAGFRVTSRKQYVRIMIGPKTCYPHAFSTAIDDRDI